MSKEPETFSREMLQKAVERASRMQGEHQDKLTAQEIEAIAVELGVEPTFIRQALAQLPLEQDREAQEKAKKKEFWSIVATFAFPVLWGTLAFLFRSRYHLFALFAFPLAVLLGLFSGHKKVSFWAAAALLWVMIPANGDAIPLAVLLWWLTGLLGKWGASLRQEYFPIPSPPVVSPSQEVSRKDLLNLIFALQSRLESQKQHWVFLSIDVVGSSEMKRDVPELAVEHSFHQFREWVEETVRAQGGEVHSTAGDGLMCMFPEDRAAIQAAQELQRGLQKFNNTQNRLPTPFRIRCGISAGEVAIEEGMPMGHLQSLVIDRAAALQKQAEPGAIVISEEVMQALPESEPLTRLAEPVEGEAAFSWQEEPSSLAVRRE